MNVEALDWGFSCPQSGHGRTYTEFVVTDHTQQVVAGFIDERGGELKACAPGVADLMSIWLATPAAFDTVWDIAFGDLYAALSNPTIDPSVPAAEVAIRLIEGGLSGEWEAHFSAPCRLRFGRWLLPAADVIRVSADVAEAQVNLLVGGVWQMTTYCREERGWKGVDLTTIPFVEVADTEVAVLGADALSPLCARRLLTADAYAFDAAETTGSPEWIDTCQNALTLIHDASDLYHSWVRTVLRAVVPLKARGQTLNSGSERFSPGAVCVSDQQQTWLLAETLVHEATHQYFNIATRLGALDDGSDQRLHFSPFRNKDRPMLYILVAYHAFGNVLLFYRAARDQGFAPPTSSASDALANREQTLAAQLRVVEPMLRDATSVTPLGRAMWEPLSHQLNLDAS